jgi:hypothetical protein
MKNLHLYISLLFVLTCAKEDSQAPNTSPSQITMQYTLTASAGDGGSVTGGGTFASGTQVSLTATPTSGYSFSGWSNGSTTNPLTVTLNSNTSITANFQVIVNSYTLTVSAGEGGSVTTEGGEYEEGTEVTITATPQEGYGFIGWNGSDSSSSTISVTVTSNTTIEAIFNEINSILYQEKNLIQDYIYIDQPSSVQFNDDTFNHETDDYIINKGWLSFTVNENHNGGYYGTGGINSAYFYMSFDIILYDDLNNDGLEDAILSTSFGPTTIESNQIGIPFFALINKGDGTFDYSQDYFDNSFERTPMNAYRSSIADINNDGVNDFILGRKGKPVISKIDGGTNTAPENPILALSNGSGGYYDASMNLNGIYEGTVNASDDQNQDGFADFLSPKAHTLGDFDNDGDVDFFMTSKILLNDGTGKFNISPYQLIDQMIPLKIYPPYSYTYEAHSDDFNNDGYDDIIILPTSPFIVDKGGSGWIVMSDGTQDVTNWTKVNLPTPIYPNNTKLNHIKSFDFNNDGYMDIVIASTRHEPYYRGAGIQLIRNDNGNDFVDVTNSNIADQSRFDQWSGEGTLILKDVNNDNKTDIIHLTSNTSDGPPNEHHGTNIYINNNGYFDIYDTDNQLPSINWTQFSGYGQFTNLPDLFYLVDQAFPININNDSKIDFISLKSVKQNDASPSPSKHVFYSIISKQ